MIFDPPWWFGATIYQIYPRSFYDSNGDGIGDLPGVTEKLEHIQSLGVDAIWLSPFFTSPQNDFGYDISDYRDIDPMFGTLADFDILVEESHKRNLKIIIDQVYSHTSSAHPWFEESRQDRNNEKSDWYVWANPKEDGSPPSNWQSVFGGPAWQWDSRRCQYYLHNFLTSQPDLNLHNVEVQDELLRVGKFWLDRGVDGFRLDAINFSMHDPEFKDNPPRKNWTKKPTRPFDFQDKIYNQSHPDIVRFVEHIRRLMDAYPDRFTVAEIGGDNALAEMKLFTNGDRRLNSAYSFTYLYADAISPKLVKQTSKDWPDQDEVGWPSWAFSNHDAPRAISRWGRADGSVEMAKIFAMLLFSLRGNIFIYQGDELGLDQSNVPFELLQDREAIENWPNTLGRDGARTPFPWTNAKPLAGFSSVDSWLPIGNNHFDRAHSQQIGQPNSVLRFYQALGKIRKENAALKYGTIKFVEASDDILCLKRVHNDDALVGLFNLSDHNRHISQQTIDAISSDPLKSHLLLSANAPTAQTTHDLIANGIQPYSGFLFKLTI